MAPKKQPSDSDIQTGRTVRVDIQKKIRSMFPNADVSVRRVELSPQEILIDEGMVDDQMYFVESGKLEEGRTVRVTKHESLWDVLNECTPGDFAHVQGVTVGYRDAPALNRVIAVTDATLIAIAFEDFESSPKIQQLVLEYILQEHQRRLTLDFQTTALEVMLREIATRCQGDPAKPQTPEAILEDLALRAQEGNEAVAELDGAQKALEGLHAKKNEALREARDARQAMHEGLMELDLEREQLSRLTRGLELYYQSLPGRLLTHGVPRDVIDEVLRISPDQMRVMLGEIPEDPQAVRERLEYARLNQLGVGITDELNIVFHELEEVDRAPSFFLSPTLSSEELELLELEPLDDADEAPDTAVTPLLPPKDND